MINLSIANLENFDQSIRQLFDLAGVQKQELDSLYWYNSGLPHGMFNFVFAKQGAAEKDLLTCIKDLDTKPSPFFFVDGLTSETSKNLCEQGISNFVSFGKLDGLSFDLSWDLPNLPLNENLNISVVNNPTDFEKFACVAAQSAGIDANIGPQFYNDFNKYIHSNFKAILATIDSKPVGCSLLFMPDGDIAGNYSGWVLPEYRKQGVNSAMAAERLKIARMGGYKRLVVQCMDTSTRLYSRLGFEKNCELDLYGRIA